MNDSIKPEDLVERRVYRIRSRNLLVGVWNPATKGFIGIREKLGSRYLFTEYEWDLVGEPSGTARAVEDLGIDVPAEVAMAERLGTVCNKELRPIEHDPTAVNPGRIGQNKGWWVHLDDHTPITADACGYAMAWPNKELFELLEPLDEAATRAYLDQDQRDAYDRRVKERKRER